MKVMNISKPYEMALAERDMPRICSSDEVIIKVKRVGICGSDIHIYSGSNPFVVYPRVWGHEFTGELVELGADVKDLCIGDHVVGEPIEYCGKCYACRQGRGNVCLNLQVFGVHLDGGCQEYLKMKRDKVYKIDSSIPWDTAVLAEPMTIGFQSCSRGRVQAGDIVFVMGAGTIGLTCMLAAKELGATVVISDLFNEKLEYAKKLGADYTINAKEQTAEAFFEEFSQAPNVILDAVGIKSSLEQAVELVSPAGRVVELGFANIKSEIPHVTIMKKEVDVCGTRLQVGKFPKAVSYIEAHRDLLESFITQRFEFSQVQEAFNFVINNPGEVRKAVINMGL